MWDPLRELTSMENRLERFFNAPFSRGVLSKGEKEAMTVTQWAPLVDISEDDKEYLVRAEPSRANENSRKKKKEKSSIVSSVLTVRLCAVSPCLRE